MLWHKRKISTPIHRPFEIIETYGPVAYRLRLPSQLAAIHDVFHVSQLRKCIKEPAEILEPQDIKIESDLSYTEYPIKILYTKERSTRREKVKCTRFSGIIIPRKKLLGRLKIFSKETFLTFLEQIQVSTLPLIFFL